MPILDLDDDEIREFEKKEKKNLKKYGTTPKPRNVEDLEDIEIQKNAKKKLLERKSKPKLRELTKAEKDEIKELKKRDGENTKDYQEFKDFKTVKGKKIPVKKYNEYSNEFMNKGQFLRKQIIDIERKPMDEYNIKKINDAFKRKEFDEDTRDRLIRGVENAGIDELDLYYYQRGMPTEFDYNKARKEREQKEKKEKEDYERYLKGVSVPKLDFEEPKPKPKTKISMKKLNKMDEDIENENKRISNLHKTLKKENIDISRSSKVGNIMKARSDLKKKGDKYTIDTEMNIKKGLDKKIKSALKKSIVTELDTKLKGSGIRKINLDYSSDEDEKSKKGKGMDFDDSSSDEDEIKTYGQMLKHLVSHIKDPKEPIDPKDYKQAVMLIKKIKSKKT